jgi:lipoprotein-releasing system permease protein
MKPETSDTRPFAGLEWMIAARYLRARRREGFISVIAGFSFLGIMLGVATLIIVMAVMNGFRSELMDKILGFAGHANVFQAEALPIVDYQALTRQLRALPGVTSAIPYVEGQVMIASERQATGGLVRGLREADIKAVRGLINDQLRGTLEGFDVGDGVAIGWRMAFKHQLTLGGDITLIAPNGPETPFGTAPRIRNFPIVALFNFGMSEYDENVIYMPLHAAQEYFLIDEGASGIEVKVDDPEAIDRHVEIMAARLGPHYTFLTWKRRNETFFSALAVERNVMFIILSLIILVAALNIISGLIMLVKDKAHDIAILRTMGASSATVQRVFLITGASIGVVGTLAGFVAGVLVCINIESIRQFVAWLTRTNIFPAEAYYLSQLPADMDPVQTAWAVALALVLSVVATLYPSWRAARLDPVDALRYE